MRILIIDDDPAGSDILEMLLSPTQATIQPAYNGELGISCAKEFDPDIILLDYMLPGMDGMQTTKALRKVIAAPILIISVVDDPTILARVLDEGADDFLIKPVSREVLIAHINNLVRRFDYPRRERSLLKVSLQSI